MDLRHEVKRGVLVIQLDGEVLDAAQSASFKQEVFDLIDQIGVAWVVFDLTPLQFIDSSGLGAFLSVLRYTNGKGGDLKIAHMTPSVVKMFRIVRMHKLFEIFESVADAVGSFAVQMEGPR